MVINPETKRAIKQIPITIVAEQLGIVVKRKKALCYTGHDTTPSLQIDDKRGFHCFGCGEKGDVIDLVSKVLKLSFSEACKWLMERFNIYQDPTQLKSGFVPLVRTIEARIQDTNNFLPNPEIYEWLIKKLTLSEKGRNYLTQERGFPLPLIEKLEIKDIPEPSRVFNGLMKRWGEEALFNCGLIRVNERKEKFFNWWGHVILFPCTDVNFRIDYLQARLLYARNIKYINLNGLPPGIYNLNVLQETSGRDPLLICEGIPDTITALALGFKAIGVLGAHSFNERYVKILMDYDLYLVPDADRGGKSYLENVKTIFGKYGKTVRVFAVPPGFKDLNEYYTKKHN